MRTLSITPQTLPEQAQTSEKANMRVAIFLGLCMLFAVAMSVLFFSRQSLRLDESQSLWQSSHSIPRFLNILGGDVHVPLYGLLLLFWERLFGISVPVARLLSLAFFLASIPLSYQVGKLAFGQTTGLTTAALVATSPFLNWYGNEIRMYSLLTFLCLLNQFYFLQLLRTDSGKQLRASGTWIGYIITSILGVYTHYFFALVLLTQAGFVFLNATKFPKNTFRNIVLIGLLAMVSLTPWIYYAVKLGSIGNSEPLLTKPNSVNLFSTYSQFLFGFQNDHLNSLLLSLWPLAVLLGFASLRKHKYLHHLAGYFLLMSVVPVAAAFVVSVFYKPVFLSRYLIFSVPLLYVFLAWFFTQYSRGLGILVRTGLVATMIFMLLNQARGAEIPVKENYQEASGYIAAHAQSQDVVALSAPFTVYPFEFYYTGPAQMVTIPYWNQISAGAIPTFSQDKLISQVTELKQSHENIYLLLSYNQGYEQDILQYFETHFERIDQKNFSPDMDLYVYKLRYDGFSLQN